MPLPMNAFCSQAHRIGHAALAPDTGRIFPNPPALALPPQDQAGTVQFIRQFLPDFKLVTNAQPAALEAAAGADVGGRGFGLQEEIAEDRVK